MRHAAQISYQDHGFVCIAKYLDCPGFKNRQKRRGMFESSRVRRGRRVRVEVGYTVSR